MGHSYAYPTINLNSTKPPEMKWYKVYHKNEQAGDILASFELVKVNRNILNSKVL